MSAPTVRHRIWRVLQADTPRGSVGYYLNVGLAALIALNILDIIAETIPDVATRYGVVLRAIEYLSVAVFSFEYILRLWTCVEGPRYQRPILGRLRYALTPMALVDLLAIAPFFIPWIGTDLLTLRAFRLIRLLRLLKLGRYSEALQLMGRVIAKKRAELMSTAVVAGFLLVIAATLLHAAESEAQPDRFGTLPDSMWWAVVTMTTVGYGDVYPQTPLGKILGSVVAFLGVGLFALPTGILGAGFLEETVRRNKAKSEGTRCPHCGKPLEI